MTDSMEQRAAKWLRDETWEESGKPFSTCMAAFAASEVERDRALAAAEPDCRAIRRKYRVEGARVMELHIGNAEAQLMTPEQVVDARWPEDAPKEGE